MSNDNQFWLGLLKGAYEGGLGNPAVGEARKQSELEQQYKQAQLNQNAAEKGMVPDTSQNYAHPAHPIWDTIKSAMFPGGGGQPLQTAFKPDPNAMVYGQDPTGTVSTSKGAVAPGSVKLPTEKGATLLAEQARKKSGEKDTPFDQARALATLSGDPKALDQLITNAQSQGRDYLTKDEMANFYKSMTASSNKDKAGYYKTRAGQLSLQNLPSLLGKDTAPGAAYQVKVATRQLKSLVANPGIPQRMGLAGADLARAVTRSVPTEDILKAAGFDDTLKTRAASLMQKITSKPESIDTPEIRKQLYDLADELDKAAEPWIANHMASRRSNGFSDPQEEYDRQLGRNLPNIPFNDGGGKVTAPGVATPFADPKKEARYQAWKASQQ